MDHPSVKNVLSFCLAMQTKKGKRNAYFCALLHSIRGSIEICSLPGNWTTLHLVFLPLCGEGLSIRYKADTMWDSVRKSQVAFASWRNWRPMIFLLSPAEPLPFYHFPWRNLLHFPRVFRNLTFISSQFDNCQLSA